MSTQPALGDEFGGARRRQPDAQVTFNVAHNEETGEFVASGFEPFDLEGRAPTATRAVEELMAHAPHYLY